MDSSFTLPDLSAIRDSQIYALSPLDTDTSQDSAFHKFSPVLHDNGLYYISPPSATYSSSVLWKPGGRTVTNCYNLKSMWIK